MLRSSPLKLWLSPVHRPRRVLTTPDIPLAASSTGFDEALARGLQLLDVTLSCQKLERRACERGRRSLPGSRVRRGCRVCDGGNAVQTAETPR